MAAPSITERRDCADEVQFFDENIKPRSSQGRLPAKEYSRDSSMRVLGRLNSIRATPPSKLAPNDVALADVIVLDPARHPQVPEEVACPRCRMPLSLDHWGGVRAVFGTCESFACVSRRCACFANCIFFV